MVLLCAAGIVGCAHPPLNRVAVAYATFNSTAGESRGEALLWQDPGNIVHVELNLHDLPPGEHGIHFHAVGKCEGGATAFSTAGAHYNPIGRQHGLNNPAGPHNGDAPNVMVGADGRAKSNFTTDRISLTAGSTTLFDDDGAAMVSRCWKSATGLSRPIASMGMRWYAAYR